MVIVITIIHVIVSIGLILVVLLQTGMAIVFMITSLTLGYFAGHKPSATIFDSRTPTPQTTPAAPEAPPAQKQSDATGRAPTETAPASPQATQPQKSTKQ